MNNKGNTHNNEFYACNTCNKNICPLCKTIHDKNHFIINYDDKNYVCKKHNETFIKYCITCHENICIICQNEQITENNTIIPEGNNESTMDLNLEKEVVYENDQTI